jgi:hypothetical protein
MPTPPVNVVGSRVELPEPISIDGGDDGSNTFLDMMRENFKNAPPHHSAGAAFENVVGSRQGTLIGHGQPGLILTGRGADFDFRTNPDQTKSISIDNTKTWELVVTPMRTPIEFLMLFGCNVGAEADGAELVWQVAKALGATVKAPVGLVWPDTATQDPFVADNECWQVADHTMTKRPDARKCRPLTPSGHEADRLLLWDVDRFLPIALEAVSGARLAKRDRYRTRGWDMEWSAPEAQSLASHVAFDRPLVFPGPLGTIVTGKVFLSYRFLGREITRQFLVHNDLLLEDANAPGVFYEINVASIVPA